MTTPTYKASSPYRDTPFREFYLDLWNPVRFPPTADDPRITLESRHTGRPDLLAYELYGSPNFWWVFAITNPNELVDPVEDFQAGLEIRVPLVSQVQGGIAR